MEHLYTDGEILTKSQANIFKSFLKMLSISKCEIVMRGDSYKNFQELYNDNVDNPNLLGYYLFMLGPKAKKFLTDKYYIDVNNTESGNFIRICATILNFLDNINLQKFSQREYIKKFINNNQLFYEFLHIIAKNQEIIDKYNKLKIIDKITINSYYLSIVHTICNNNSIYVSSSNEKNVADFFAKELVIYAWNSPNYTISHNTSSEVYKLGFPTYLPVYPKQNEFSFKYGILPHFIIGFEIIKNNSFYINPAIFNEMNKIKSMETEQEKSIYKKTIFKRGLEIDQEHFDDVLRETNLKGYFQTDGEQFNIIAY